MLEWVLHSRHITGFMNSQPGSRSDTKLMYASVSVVARLVSVARGASPKINSNSEPWNTI